jgi:hypothetical protein
MLHVLFIVIGYSCIAEVLSADGDVSKMSKYMFREG